MATTTLVDNIEDRQSINNTGTATKRNRNSGGISIEEDGLAEDEDEEEEGNGLGGFCQPKDLASFIKKKIRAANQNQPTSLREL
jgi:hypothetical protein